MKEVQIKGYGELRRIFIEDPTVDVSLLARSVVKQAGALTIWPALMNFSRLAEIELLTYRVVANETYHVVIDQLALIDLDDHTIYDMVGVHTVEDADPEDMWDSNDLNAGMVFCGQIGFAAIPDWFGDITASPNWDFSAEIGDCEVLRQKGYLRMAKRELGDLTVATFTKQWAEDISGITETERAILEGAIKDPVYWEMVEIILPKVTLKLYGVDCKVCINKRHEVFAYTNQM